MSLNIPAFSDLSNILIKSLASPPATFICAEYSFMLSNKSPCAFAPDKNPFSNIEKLPSAVTPKVFINTFCERINCCWSASNTAIKDSVFVVKLSNSSPVAPVVF